MSTENKETKILLSPENYALWLLPMKAKLHKNKSLQVVNGSVACPDPEKDKENFRLYAKLNEDAYIEIIQHLNQEVLAYVSTTLVEADEFNGLKLWQLLKSKFAGNDLTSKTTALKRFLAIEFSPLPTFLPTIRSANHRIVVSGLSLDDQVKTILMLDKLPKTFESFKTNISMNFESESFENVLKKLEDFGAQNQLNDYSPSSVPVQGLLTRQTIKPCIHCKKPGHQPANCWVKYPEKAPKTEAAHVTLLDNFVQHVAAKEESDPTDFSWFRTADGVRHHVDEIRYENVKYFN